MIHQLALVPEQGSFIRGYAGLTPQLTLTGEIHFEATRDVSVYYVDVFFKGLVRTQITVSTLRFEQEEVIYDMNTRLVNGDPPKEYQKGTNVIPFKIIIDDPALLTNYTSPALNEKVTDGAFITYDLHAEIQYKGGIFNNKKIIERVSEPINLPSIKWDQVMAALKPQVLEFEEIISNDKVQIIFDKHAIYIGSSLNIKIETSGLVEFLKAQLVQTETVYCEGQIRKFDYVLAESTPVQKSKKSKVPIHSVISFDLKLKDQRIKNSKSKFKSVDVVTSMHHKMVSISHQLKADFTISGRIEQVLLPVLVLDLDQDALDRLRVLIEP